jgi:endonuclease YncB( thermonuclease family)
MLWPKPPTIFLAIIILLTGCGQSASTSQPGAISREAVILPTSIPSPKPTPVSTRVIPVEDLTPAPTPTITPIPDDVRGVVVGVLDGRTITVVMEGDPPDRIYQVRYLGIDAPSAGGPWGDIAYNTNRKMVGFKVVRLVRDQSNFDDQGYLLRYVYLENELLSIILTEQGLARAAIIPPDTRFETEILEAETRARDGKLGLWGGTPTLTPSPAPETEEGTVESGEGTAEPAEAASPTSPTVTTESTTPQATPTNEISTPHSNPSTEPTDEDVSNATVSPTTTQELP